MLVYHLKRAGANLLSQGFHTLVSLVSLVLGMTACILIMLYVLDELSYDDWLPDGESVFRVETIMTDASGNERLVRKSALRARRDLQEYFPEIAAATRIIDQTVTLGVDGEEALTTAWFVDPGFLDVFQLSLLSGSANALTDKTSILLSATMAEKYFPENSPLGRVVQLDDGHEYRIAGVFADMPRNTHVKFNVIVPYDEADTTFNFGYSESWSAVEGYTYVKLAAGVDPAEVAGHLSEFRQHHAQAVIVPAGPLSQLLLRNVRDIHLDAGGFGNIEEPGNLQMLVTLGGIALLVLTIASMNFVNLSAVQALARAKEASLRKTLGAMRRQLLAQFLCESVLLSLLALIVATSLVELVQPLYNNLLGRDIGINYGSLIPVVLAFLAVALGIVSGFLPAWHLSAWKPAMVLRSGFSSARQTTRWLQTVLVTAQFAISATLVMTTAILLLQQAFIQNKDLGYEPENKLVIRNLGEDFIADKRELFAAEVARLPQVTGTAVSVATPGDTVGAGFYRQVTIPGYKDEEFPLYPKPVDANFFEVYGVPLLSGRGFSDELRSDRFFWPDENATDIARSTAVMNAAAVQAVGLRNADDAIGKIIRMPGIDLEIIGVVPDINFQSLRASVTPNLYIYSPDDFAALTVSYAAGSEDAVVAAVTRVWEALAPGFPPVIEFVEENIRAQYAQDRLQFLLVTIFSCLAIALACLGLYALAAWSTRQRTREIGIRKVHGAFSNDIVQLLLLQFSKPLVIANVLAWPVAWFVMNRYLDGFAYRIEPGAAVFILATLATMAIAWSAIVLHVVKVANAKPVLALRYE